MRTKKMSGLSQKLSRLRKEIHADSYPMSIGELSNLYRDREIDIHPEFQRVYRWTEEQKSNLIESILLGIPLPSIFVAQRDDGIWDVVDGLQRLSTIFSFMGILKDENGNFLDPLVLQETKYLPELKGAIWENGEGNSLPASVKLDFKREKIDIKIIKKESTPDTKYELFQRLNTGGTPLSQQEVRHCLMIMLNKEFYEWFEELSKNKDFIGCLTLTERMVEEQYHSELALRFLVLHNLQDKEDIDDIGKYITKKMEEMANDAHYDYATAQQLFNETFSLLNESLGDDAFRRYDTSKKKYLGGFSVAIFEVMSIGLACNFNNYKIDREKSIEKIRKISMSLSNNTTFKKYSKAGVRASSRVSKLIPFAKKVFRDENKVKK